MKSNSSLRMAMLFGASALMLSVVSCKDDKKETPASKNVVETAKGDANLSILVSAVTKANLATTLSNNQNITVFAPTNAAFTAAGYPQTRIDALTSDEVRTMLTPLLTYHVVSKKINGADVPVSDTVRTMNGLNIYASRNANGTFVNGKKVSKADVAATNGVIHIIDAVLMPPTQTIAQIVSGNPNLSLLLTAVVKAELASTLNGRGKFTVFAPVNAGFPESLDNNDKINALPSASVAALIKQHTFGTNIFASDLTNGDTQATLEESKVLTVTTAPPVTVKLKNSTNAASKVTQTDIVATNGVIHIIDKVIQ